MSDLRQILNRYRDAAVTERGKGTSFENIVLAYFRHDPMQVESYEAAWTFGEWATAQGIDGRDTGIDLVAKIRGEDTYCAIQCKFYAEDYRIQKSDIDSFFTASGKVQFSRRIIVDSTSGDWSANAEAALDGQAIPCYRIGLTDLEQSNINWGDFVRDGSVIFAPPKTLRPHQKEALEAIRKGFTDDDRGKLIMACGTGKTFTGLKISEDLAGVGKTVLYMVPSLSLMSQTVREWTNDAELPIRFFAVCSDQRVGVRSGRSDFADIEQHDLAYPATTDPAKLGAALALEAPDKMTVIFSTYHSIETISKAQLWHDMTDFDLIICDEAHRTTGAIFEDEDQSNFTKIHDDAIVRGKKRLYMTATPRVYGEGVKSQASEASVELCSMDDEDLYGKTLFTRGFSWAVENELLTDYKVIVLAVDEGSVSEGIQRAMTEDSELKLDDATKIIGCYKALTKQDLADDLITDRLPMRRALAFCKDIKTSKLVTRQFKNVVDDYLDTEEEVTGEGEKRLTCELDHVDGTFNAKQRESLLHWLKEDTDGACRILSNARCLSEGVDVPALDAILFLHPRKSQIDVVQSVGRVMRRAPNKKLGYVILPVAIPAGMTPEDALNDNERYKVVWQILNALRSHDERMDATINRIGYGEDVSDKIEIIAVTNNLPNQKPPKTENAGLGQGGGSNDDDDDDNGASPTITRPVEPEQYPLWVDEFAAGIRAKIVKKCGTKTYWEDWAGDIARIADVHITRIRATLSKPNTPERAAFDAFLEELRDDLNPAVSEDEAIEMLAQHIITKPVFDAMFEEYSFAKNNSIAGALDTVLAAIHADSMEGERETLERFYGSVKRRAASLQTAEAKQKVIVQLYDSFFRNAFPKMTERLGIVYTPVEVVDFIIKSVDEVLRDEFDTTLGAKGVHILDPFVGTGTFITRLLQSGLIKPEEMAHKYRHEIHANEIVLLAYYIAAINIEAVYHDVSGGDFAPFDGICLTDTFQLYEQEKDMIADLMPDNSERRTRQKGLDIRVIVGNPPYSAGQNSANDNAANLNYPNLDNRIADTYAKRSTATLKNALYDSYIRAIRWASDRIGDAGIFAFVSNAGWVDGNAMDGLRKCLADEYSSLYVFHLRGNQRTSGERSRKEGGKIFGSGSRTPVSINVFVKNPNSKTTGQIKFHDIGDYLKQDEKLHRIATFSGLAGITKAGEWQDITPDDYGDWVNKRDRNFENYYSLGGAKTTGQKIFIENSHGVMTSRDAWSINFSKTALIENTQRLIDTYSSAVNKKHSSSTISNDHSVTDKKRISWSRGLRKSLDKKQEIQFEDGKIVPLLYRPFTKQWIYFNRSTIEMPGKTVNFYDEVGSAQNLAITVVGKGEAHGFSALLANTPVEYKTLYNNQSFPLRTFQKYDEQIDLSASNLSNVNKSIIKKFERAYPNNTVVQEDVFYYIYGLLHSEDYRERYADNLSKELPRIPCVKTAADFWHFVDAGRKLGDLHVNYETVEPYPVHIKEGSFDLANIDDEEAFFRVEKMKFGGKRPNQDKTTVHYNKRITMQDIPLEAYDYVVNGKPALEWVMERQCVKTDKASGIVNDANRYAIETVGDPAYPLKLFQRVITVSLETMKIVRGLPKLDLQEPKI